MFSSGEGSPAKCPKTPLGLFFLKKVLTPSETSCVPFDRVYRPSFYLARVSCFLGLKGNSFIPMCLKFIGFALGIESFEISWHA